SGIVRDSCEPSGRSQVSSARRFTPIRAAKTSRVRLRRRMASRKKTCWATDMARPFRYIRKAYILIQGVWPSILECVWISRLMIRRNRLPVPAKIPFVVGQASQAKQQPATYRKHHHADTVRRQHAENRKPVVTASRRQLPHALAGMGHIKPQQSEASQRHAA